MKKLFLLTTGFCFAICLLAQEKSTPKKKDWSKVKLVNRANDHIMLQYGITNWAGKSDSLNVKTFSRSFNFYVMIDMPFKTDPRISIAFGPGIGTDNIFFEGTNVTTTNHSKDLEFRDVADTNHFDKYKLVTAFLELPVELRFSKDPENSNKSFKVALGAKVGVLVSSYTKGKRWVDKDGSIVSGFDDKYVRKDKDKYFFNGNRLVATARVGYGNLSLYGTYQIGSLIKDGLGPQVKPYSIGLTISGL